MKAFRVAVAALVMVGIQLTIASPTCTGLSVRTTNEIGNLTMADMKWSGRICAKDTHDTVLSGDAKSIWQQIISINPNYAEENGLVISTEPIRPGQLQITAINAQDYDRINCDSDGDQVFMPHCAEGLTYLQLIGHGEGLCNVGPNSCVRISCSWNCGIYVCSLTENGFAPLCRDVADDMWKIYRRCKNSDPVLSAFAKGQLLFDDQYTKLRRDDC